MLRTELNLENFLKETQKRKAPCIHQSYCGGCPLMQLPYEKQIELKSKIINEIFSDLIKEELNVIAANNEFFYRNKIELSYNNGKLGFKLKNSWKNSFELKECLLVSNKSNEIINFISKELKEKKIESFNPITKKGFLSHVTLREAKKTNDFMVVFTLKNTNNVHLIDGIAKQLMNSFNVSSIKIVLNESKSDTAFGETINSFGKEFIEEIFLDLKLHYNEQNFFQANVFQAEKLFSEIISEIKKEDFLLDLFCGIGTLTLPAALKAKKVIGIELNNNSILMAKKNAKINKIKNARFIAGNVRAKLKFFEEKPNIISLDPPRAGCSKKTIERIKKLCPEKIFYVSCNPLSLKKDLELILKEKEFNLRKLKGIDFFPQTNHIEMLAVIEKN